MVSDLPQLRLPPLDHRKINCVALAVSGGSDSMALLRLAMLARGDVFRNIALVAFTVDHGLRDGSDLEAAQVGRWCQAHDVPHETLRWHGGKPASGLQAAARRARYDLMTDACVAMRIGLLLTAHTADDQAETVAMRMARTDSPKSLAGIWPEMTWNGVSVFRPLLHERRETLRCFLQELGQSWIDDPSNDDIRFERVRLRKAGAARNVSMLMARAEAAIGEAMANSAAAQEWLERHHGISRFGHVDFGRDSFARLSVAVQCEVLSILLKMLGGKAPLRAKLRSLVTDLRGDALFRRTLGGALVSARRHDVIICREAGRIPPEMTVPADGTVIWDGRFRIVAPPGTVVRPLGQRRAFAAYPCPAYVVAALPEVTIAGTPPFLPHFEGADGISVSLSEGFGL